MQSLNEAITDAKKRELAYKLQESRIRLIANNPFYGLLLLNMKFSLDLNAGTAYTDGDRIAFEPLFLDGLTSKEVDYVLMHEVLHTALGHVWRGEDFSNQETFNYAADIVVNSNILQSNHGDLSSITLADSGETMHNLPDGREGYLFSAEEIYPIIENWMAKDDHEYSDLTSKRKSEFMKTIQGKEDKDGNWDNHDKWSNPESNG